MVRLGEVDSFVRSLFGETWASLHPRGSLARPALRFPGAYILAYSEAELDGAAVAAQDVLYVGMSNAAGGVRHRLKQFLDGIEKKRQHSGAMRFYREYCGDQPFSKAKTGKQLYFAAVTVPCVSNKVTATAGDLRLMGLVACLEYYVIAHVVEVAGRRPPLNPVGRTPPLNHSGSA
jgi:hypothetical protein